ncbi:hypothetical protein Poli38472_006707 [Pythium oligandrum]|uniref:DNA topoisomerase (ATP-hydrolyzing) n=1 Tax=Pythium oligandrum TaxID=41045 RepID=A0A8K1C609_PYTOL|nr:hypothetical protein Poli38472_006707 [Pythium oligandrum]|eukprot:TMW56697.1 hypothetical protein Poli38472_006707 [Pythium oligandrum]
MKETSVGGVSMETVEKWRVPAREEILTRIEELATMLVECTATGSLMDMETLRRTSDAMVYDHEKKHLIHSDETRVIRLNRGGARKYTAVWLVLHTVYELLSQRKTVTQREIYYMHPFFKNQNEADEAILDTGCILRAPRGSLNIVGATKGCFSGCLKLMKEGEWRSYNNGDEHPITQQILQAKPSEIASDACCILVVEKDGIFNRLREDRFVDQLPSIIVTGRGFPDLATREFVSLLSRTLELPVIGLSDCNPFGLSIMLTYKLGSARMPLDTRPFGVDIKWVGLRPSRIEQLDLPPTAFKELSSKDRARAKSLAQSDFVQSHCEYVEEVRMWSESAFSKKVELEALHLLGFGYLSGYVAKSIINHQYI